MEKYYLVDELDNCEHCFSSIKEIWEELEYNLKEDLTKEEFIKKLDSLTIYNAKEIKIEFDAQEILERCIYDLNDLDGFELEDIDNDKIVELQTLLNEWSNKIHTNYYVKDKLLSKEEILERLEKEEEQGY